MSGKMNWDRKRVAPYVERPTRFDRMADRILSESTPTGERLPPRFQKPKARPWRHANVVPTTPIYIEPPEAVMRAVDANMRHLEESGEMPWKD